MDPTNVQNLRKNSNANVLQIFAFAFLIVSDNVKGKVGNLLTMWRTNVNEDA